MRWVKRIALTPGSHRRAAGRHWTHFAVNVQSSALDGDIVAAPHRIYALIADQREWKNGRRGTPAIRP